MLKPDYLLHISEGAEDIAEQLHTDIVNRIVERIMVRIGRGDNYILTAQDKWQLEVLQDAGYLLEDIQKEIAKRTYQQEKEIAEAMEEAGVKALSYDDAIYQAAGLSPIPLLQSPALMRLMQRNYEATMGEWRNYTRTTASAAQQLFLKALDKAYTLTASGTVSYTQAVKSALNEIVQDGVVVKYPSGHRDTIETATLRAVRTGISQATGAIQMERMEEMDWDIILTSAHLGARSGDGGQNPSNHLWWQGQFFSRTGSTPGLPLFAEATGYGTEEWGVVGLCGANCRHSFGPGDGVNNPFATKDLMYADNAKAEQLQQRQRELERRIRKTKREVMALKTAVDNASDEKLKFELDQDYQRKSALLQKQNQAYKDFCEQNGLKPLQDRIQIAKWDRQQAAEARGAAQRYENKEKQKPSSLGAGMGSSGGTESVKKFVGTIDYGRAKEAVSYFNDQIRNELVENAIVIDKNGQVYHFIGDESNVDIFDVTLEGAYITHNHPESHGILSFGLDDFDYIKAHPEIKELHCCNKEYDYALEILKPLDKLAYSHLYSEALNTMDPFTEEIQDKVMQILAERGYIRYDKKRLK